MESLAADLNELTRTPLFDTHVAEPKRLGEFAMRAKIPFKMLQPGRPEAREAAETCDSGALQSVGIFGKNRVVHDHTPAKIVQLPGLAQDVLESEIVDVLIVGCGPAGVAAGVNAQAEGHTGHRDRG